MARAVVQRQRNPIRNRFTEQVFPDPDLLLSLDEDPAPRQARVLSFPESDSAVASWHFEERAGTGAR